MKNIIKKFQIFICMLILFFSVFSVKLDALNDYVYLGGESIGLNVTSGVFITGKYKVSTIDGFVSPWKKANLEKGDYIIQINNQKIKNVEDVNYFIETYDDINITVSRDEKLINTTIRVVEDINSNRSIGLYLKDQINGIGTMSFIYDNHFASLGHSINNQNLKSETSIGSIYNSKVFGIRKASTSLVGEKKATTLNERIGKIYKNNDFGVFGEYFSDDLKSKEKIEIAEVEEVVIGKAKMLTVIFGTEKEYFDILIVSCEDQKTKDVKGLKVQVIDEKLIEHCGGIIQGMSGSPIIQNGKLIGVISHVVANSPLDGYGIYAKWMKNELIDY